MKKRILLGIDSGATNAKAILVDQTGLILGEGQAGPGNYHNVGIEQAGKNLAAATAMAWRESGQEPRPADAAFIGSCAMRSGVDLARMRALAESARLAPAGHVEVQNDMSNALAGGLAGRPGIALIAGTGSNCLGRNEAGERFMCGGWGWLIDDEGGAIGLTLRALRAAVRSVDGRAPASALVPAVLAFFGISDPNEIMARLYADGRTPDELAAFAPVLMRVAREGDPLALQVLEEGATELSRMVATVVRTLKFKTPPELVILGGCARSGEPYQPMLERVMRREVPGVRIIEPALSPLHGAALNALSMAGIHPVPALRPKRQTRNL